MSPRAANMNKPREEISVSPSVFTKLWAASHSFESTKSHYVAGSELDKKSFEPRCARYWKAVRKMTTSGDDRQVILIVELTNLNKSAADYVSWSRWADTCDYLAKDTHVACEGKGERKY